MNSPNRWSIKLTSLVRCLGSSVSFSLRMLLLGLVFAAGIGRTDGVQAATKDDDGNGLTVTFEDGQLSVDVSNAPTELVLRKIARVAGVDIAVYGEPEKTISIKFDNLRLDDALNRLLGRYNLVLLYKEVKNPAPGAPKARVIGIQVHIDEGANAPTMQFAAGRVIEKVAARERADRRNRRLRKKKEKRKSKDGKSGDGSEEDSAQTLARLKVEAFDSDPSVRADAVDELGMVDDEGTAADILGRVLREDPSPEVRANAMSGLEDFDTPPMEPVLDAVLFDEAPEVRIGAMEIIGDQEWKDQRTVDTLSRALEDPNEEIRLTALEVLDDLGERKALEVAARSNPHQEVRELAAEMLKE